MFRRASVITLLTLACAREPVEEPVATEFGWLVGEWRSSKDGRSELEVWTRVGPDRLRGINETRVDGERVHGDSIELLKTERGVVYRAKPSTQDAHEFPLEASGGRWARFSDPDHDWPQSIEYRRVADRLEATVSGMEGGEARSATWTWTLVRASAGSHSP